MATDPRILDWRFPSECPACSNRAAWNGETEERGNDLFIGMSCVICNNHFSETSGALEEQFRSADPPRFVPGCDMPAEYDDPRYFTLPTVEHAVAFAAQAPLYLLLLPGRGGRLPAVVREDRATGTGTEERTLLVDVGGVLESHRFTGALFTGVGTGTLELERDRIAGLRAALADYERELLLCLRLRDRAQNPPAHSK